MNPYEFITNTVQIIYHCFLKRFFHVKKNKLTPILIIQFSWKYGLENADVNVGT